MSRITAEEIDELEVWLNDHYRACTDTWPRMRRLIHALREEMGLLDPKIRYPTLDEFTAKKVARAAERRCDELVT